MYTYMRARIPTLVRNVHLHTWEACYEYLRSRGTCTYMRGTYSDVREAPTPTWEKRIIKWEARAPTWGERIPIWVRHAHTHERNKYQRAWSRHVHLHERNEYLRERGICIYIYIYMCVCVHRCVCVCVRKRHLYRREGGTGRWGTSLIETWATRSTNVSDM